MEPETIKSAKGKLSQHGKVVGCTDVQGGLREELNEHGSHDSNITLVMSIFGGDAEKFQITASQATYVIVALKLGN